MSWTCWKVGGLVTDPVRMVLFVWRVWKVGGWLPVLHARRSRPHLDTHSLDRLTNPGTTTTTTGMEGAGPGMAWWKTVLLDPRCFLLLRKQVR